MDLTLHLERDGAFAGRPPIRTFTLDALCELFGVIPHDRHTASGDAFITAQVFLRLLRLAARIGRGTLAGVSEAFEVGEPGVARLPAYRSDGDWHRRGGFTRYLMAMTIESGPTSGSTRVDEKPAAFIQPAQSAPV